MARDEHDRGLEISENELWILSYYRESELAGALVMGRLARETDDDDLRVHLTEHCAEEAEHAWLWTRTILAVGGTPRRVAETYQSRYFAELGPPRTVLEVLALTQVFERRVLRHFRAHLGREDVHPAVAATLRRMIADEAGHIGWVKKRLDRAAGEIGGAAVAETMRRYEEVDRRVYEELLGHRDRFAAVADPARRSGGPVAGSSGTEASGRRPLVSASPVERRIADVAARTLGTPSGRLDRETGLALLGIDSMDLLALISAVEEEFRIELTIEDAEGLFTLGDLIDRVEAREAAALR